MKIRKHSAFTLIELLVVISIIAIIAALAMPAFSGFMLKGRMTEQMSNGRGIGTAMKNYASDHSGQYPTYKDPDDAASIVNNSNDAFELLLKGYLDDKKVFFNKSSAWCRVVPKSENTAKKVQPGENDWAYVRGIKDTSPSTWPVLANAFAQGGTTYLADPAKKGGVWKGTKAVVVWAGGNAEVVETKGDSGDGNFIKRADKPSANAFEKEGDWLNGDEIQVLYPL
jgi:prepilin-type N-terminal cleavage/methylation domain-containing protein